MPRSYRDLPLRLAEYGTCYRYEQSGELLGLMRVRSLNMNDAHIYCTVEQFAEEFNAVNEMYLKYFKIFGLEKYQMRFSTHDPSRLTGDNAKFVNEPELWKKTEDMVRQVLDKSDINYVEVPNEAAFYGPKIDVQVWSAIGREFTIATNQVDFAVPAKFGLTYRDKDNSNKTPLCIHRAPLACISAALTGLRPLLTINPGRCPGLSSVGLAALSISVHQRQSAVRSLRLCGFALKN